MTRREQIMRESARLFALRGFNGVGIDEIGAAVGLTGPALYRHFSNKETLLAELLVTISDQLLDGGQAAAAAAGSPAQVLERLVRHQVRFAVGQPELISVQSRDLGNLSTAEARRVRQSQRAYVEIWVCTLASLCPGCDLTTVRATVHAVIGLINSTPHATAELPADEAVELLASLAMAALLSITRWT